MHPLFVVHHEIAAGLAPRCVFRMLDKIAPAAGRADDNWPEWDRERLREVALALPLDSLAC